MIITDKAARLRGGFIGTGIMGGHMLSHLARSGFAMTAWNRTPAKITALGLADVIVADSPQRPHAMPVS